jgi:hypothetical protein
MRRAIRKLETEEAYGEEGIDEEEEKGRRLRLGVEIAREGGKVAGTGFHQTIHHL